MKEDNIVHLYLSFHKRTSKFYTSFIDLVDLEQNGISKWMLKDSYTYKQC